MRQMVAGRLDPVEEYRRALRHAAHRYDASTKHGHAAAEAPIAADALYRAARALVAAELIHEINNK